MRTRLFRVGSLIAVAALVFAACGTSSPASSAPAVVPSASAAVATTPPSTGPATVPPGGPVEIRWFCCIGGGDAPEQTAVEKKVVDDFNKSHPNIHLTFEAVPYAGANAALATEIGSGNGPDIVGPAGIGGANAFNGQWLDLAPLIASTNYDLSGFPSDAVDIYKLSDGQFGIPFAIYPSELYYQPDMFDAASLNPPPDSYGKQYQMPDNSMVDWNYDTAANIAKILTVDKAGKDATQAGFNPKNIVQWGFEPSATICAASAPTSVRASSRPTMARRSRSPTPGQPAGNGGTTVSGRTTPP